MSKICNKDGCSYNVFGGGYCKSHQYLRADKKQKPLARTALKTSTAKGRKAKKEKADKFPADREFYLEIWEEREHVCFSSGEYLGSEPLTLYFHHCLPKKQYPQYRYCKWNIVILSWSEHTKADNGLNKKVNEYVETLKKKYL